MSMKPIGWMIPLTTLLFIGCSSDDDGEADAGGPDAGAMDARAGGDDAAETIRDAEPGGDANELPPDGGVDAADTGEDTMDAAAGADAGSVGVAVMISAVDGGTVTSSDGLLRLEIPPGALSTDTEVTIDSIAAPPSLAVDLRAGPVYSLGPDGLTFGSTVSVELRTASDATRFNTPVVITGPEEGPFEAPAYVRVQHDGDEMVLSFPLTHFSVLTRLSLPNAEVTTHPGRGGTTRCEVNGMNLSNRHRSLREILEALSLEITQPQISIESRFLELSDCFVQSLGVAFPPEATDAFDSLIAAQDLDRLEESLTHARRVTYHEVAQEDDESLNIQYTGSIIAPLTPQGEQTLENLTGLTPLPGDYLIAMVVVEGNIPESLDGIFRQLSFALTQADRPRSVRNPNGLGVGRLAIDSVYISIPVSAWGRPVARDPLNGFQARPTDAYMIAIAKFFAMLIPVSELDPSLNLIIHSTAFGRWEPNDATAPATTVISSKFGPNGYFDLNLPNMIAPGNCAPADRCIHDRFRVEFLRGGFRGRPLGDPTGVAHDADGAARFRFFDPTAPEVLVKVLDGCGINGRFWTFEAATEEVELEMQITDTTNGSIEILDALAIAQESAGLPTNLRCE